MLLIGIFLCYLEIKTVQAIDCFKCISMNNDYPPCEDPFHNNSTLDIYESPCMGGRRGKDGVFPATSCVKITGTFAYDLHKIPLKLARWHSTSNYIVSIGSDFYILSYGGNNNKILDDSDETIMIRGCALDSGTLTTDTELVRMSHCGAFYYDDRYVHGCVQTCNDAEACNYSYIIRSNFEIIIIVVSLTMALY